MAHVKTHVIKIPHLDYRVCIEHKRKGDLDDAGAYTKYMCRGVSLIVLPLPIKGKVSAGKLVHEIMHVIQYIVEDHNMTFTKEREHLAYIAGYIFEQVCELKVK